MAASSFEDAALGVVARTVSAAWYGNQRPVLDVRGVRVARLVGTASGHWLSPVLLQELARPDMSADHAEFAAFAARLVARFKDDPLLRARLAHPSFDLEMLSALSTPEALTSWALMRVDRPFPQRVAAYVRPVSERVRLLNHLMDGGAGL